MSPQNEPQPKPTWHTHTPGTPSTPGIVKATVLQEGLILLLSGILSLVSCKKDFLVESLPCTSQILRQGRTCPLITSVRQRAWRCCALEGKSKLFPFRRIVGLAQPLSSIRGTTESTSKIACHGKTFLLDIGHKEDTKDIKVQFPPEIPSTRKDQEE